MHRHSWNARFPPIVGITQVPRKSETRKFVRSYVRARTVIGGWFHWKNRQHRLRASKAHWVVPSTMDHHAPPWCQTRSGSCTDQTSATLSDFGEPVRTWADRFLDRARFLSDFLPFSFPSRRWTNTDRQTVSVEFNSYTWRIVFVKMRKFYKSSRGIGSRKGRQQSSGLRMDLVIKRKIF